ncbi:Dipicolinate synthase subunit B [bioreactor metagenome]|uniref:Dipicolinate synthase subunit B n=1 Tax=bioreactor metagenome TaxID=1076179 RepID=A0A644Z526_9ZZZZ
MDLKGLKVGYALCGSFCTFNDNVSVIRSLVKAGCDVTPIMSYNAYFTDTRFGNADDYIDDIQMLTNKDISCSLTDVEAIGPQKLLDILVISPCTGNTIGKLASGISDTPVSMAAKAHLRNGRPLIIAISTNDGLSANAQNIGRLLNMKNIYFVPFSQDDAFGKPTSLVANFSQIPETIEMAIQGKQIQPLLWNKM